MRGLVFRAGMAAFLTCVSGLCQPSYAGEVRYRACFQNQGAVNATEFDATIKDSLGLFFEFSGTLARPVGTSCSAALMPNGLPFPVGNLFMGSSQNGTFKFAEPFAAGTSVGPVGGAAPTEMLLNTLATSNTFDRNDAMTTFFDANGNQVKTVLPALSPTVIGDPVVDLANDVDNTSSVTLTNIVAQVNNSEDPLDMSADFVPDGTPVTVTPSLSPLTDVIVPGSDEAFSFSLPTDARNWSFQYTYSFDGVTFTDLVATDVPEPTSLALLGVGLVVVIGLVGGKSFQLVNTTCN